jgi:glutamate synthase (NADPH) large chain
MSDDRAYGLPPAQGLYDPRLERDACGMGFIVNIDGHKSHDIIEKGIQILINLTHRGACGCDPDTGDGAGILIQIPHEFFARECGKLGFTLPEARHSTEWACASCRWNAISAWYAKASLKHRSGRGIARARLARHSPTGRRHRAPRPRHPTLHPADLHPRRLRIEPGRARAQALCHPQARGNGSQKQRDLRDREMFYIPSLSSRTIIYKGLLLAPQIANFYGELSDREVTSALCMVHQRFSTNTFPTWNLAHPFRYLCHNGEINTLRGNTSWMNARQSVLQSPLFGPTSRSCFP